MKKLINLLKLTKKKEIKAEAKDSKVKKPQIIEIIDNEIARHRYMFESCWACIKKCYKEKYSPLIILFPFLRSKKSKESLEFQIKSYIKRQKYHRFAAGEFEVLRAQINHEIQRLVKQKKSKQAIKARVLKLIEDTLKNISHFVNSTRGSEEHEYWSQLYNDYRNLKLTIERKC